ncbi:DUF3267 domain-containing protein [Natronorarus salvus]|uniref:DUF3267 domain-containing protein n=1 Tax=Natronorarus salvus TaxID=3117733 RepID=UPI002F2624B7
MSETDHWTSGPTDPHGAPPAPDGYADPYSFVYPTVVVLVGSSLLGVLSLAGVVGLLWELQGPALFAAFTDVTVDGETTAYSVDLIAIGVPVLVALVLTAVVHELVHGAVFAHYGHEVSYGVAPAMGAFYAGAFGQFQEREALLRVGLAPLVLVTAVCVPLLIVPIPFVAITAAFVLVLNGSGAIVDLYLAWRLRRMPPGTLLYDVDIDRSYVYEPLAGDDRSSPVE